MSKKKKNTKEDFNLKFNFEETAHIIRTDSCRIISIQEYQHKQEKDLIEKIISLSKHLK
jgi:hypothetical protein